MSETTAEKETMDEINFKDSPEETSHKINGEIVNSAAEDAKNHENNSVKNKSEAEKSESLNGSEEKPQTDKDKGETSKEKSEAVEKDGNSEEKSVENQQQAEENAVDSSSVNSKPEAKPPADQVTPATTASLSDATKSELAPSPAAAPVETTPEKLVSVPSSKVTINVLVKLFDVLNSKSFKLNSTQKDIVKKCKDALADGRIPAVSLVDLLKAADKNLQLRVMVVDAISKIYTFENAGPQFNEIKYKNYTKFSDLCLDTLSSVFKDETDDAIELQIVKTVVSIVLSENVEVHTGKLLEGIRLIYNIFILTVSENTQMIAEVNLTQITDYYFQRVSTEVGKRRTSGSNSNLSSSVNVSDASESIAVNGNGSTASLAENAVNLDNLENLNLDDERKFSDILGKNSTDILIKDCFLILRSMSKLSLKSIDENFLDVRSTAVRSKLLSLRIIYSILKNHIDVFLDKSITIVSAVSNEKIPFMASVRNYLLLALTKNAVYQLNDIYSVCLDIFYIMITNLRADFLNEIPVLFSEIFFPIVDMPLSTEFQKNYFLLIVGKLANDPRLLIEFYLNFDCSENQPNIIESLINFLIRTENSNMRKVTQDITEKDAYKPTALNQIVGVLRSLYGWANKGNITDEHRNNQDKPSSPAISASASPIPKEMSSSSDFDDPSEFELAKRRKTQLLDCCRTFKFKPKKGIQKFVELGFISKMEPKEVAEFLLTNSSIIDKEVLGEYLGEGDEFNINVMHEFVDLFNFDGMKFVDALRQFLQSFRLPGESQKIDRFMLKFANTYFKSHPNGVFAEADTLYIFSYSVIMLNTDQHNDQVKSRMSVEDFIKNNSGINKGMDLPRQLLVDVYNDIANNEIILESEQHQALISGSKTPKAGGFFTRSDASKEYYIQAAKEISSKSEKVIKSTSGGNIRKSRYFSANHNEHVKSIFDTLWMSFLAALTPSFKEFDSPNITKLCLEGIKLSIKIACLFGLADARTSFVNALLQFTNLNNIEEINTKNLDAINLLLSLCISDGNSLGSSWNDILVAISQLERLQLISQGIDASNVPDILNARLERNSTDRNSIESSTSLKFFAKRPNQTELAQQHHANQKLNPDIAVYIASTEMTVKIDKIFSGTEKLSIDGICSFVEALAEVAIDEVESSGDSSNPRIFSLQKMVDICYYNMNRIRVEWSKVWTIMGSAFNKIGSNPNLTIVVFALDSLRQLSMRFFEIEELAYFKFQRDFLKPFAVVLAKNELKECRLMVLECLDNMILAKANQIRSGWSTIFESLSLAASDVNNEVSSRAYAMISKLNTSYFSVICELDAFQGLVDSYTSLACNENNQRASLHAIEDMNKLIKRVGRENSNSNTQFLSILAGLNQVVLKNSDLESRSISLDHLFDSLVAYGDQFDSETWSKTCQDLLFPIFGILSEHWTQLNTHDDWSVWLSTTLIQALKNMVAIFTRFDALISMLDGYLALLSSCILQENETISKIGRTCLHSLITENCQKFQTKDWDLVTSTIKSLFDSTTAIELFLADPLRDENDYEEILKQFSGARSSKEDPRHEKGTIVVKCVLQLQMIDTLSNLVKNEKFYALVPSENLLDMINCLKKSHRFSQEFNDNFNLRMRLRNSGVIEKLPNLLKQESSSSGVYIAIVFRLLITSDKILGQKKESLLADLIPLCVDIIREYIALDETTKQRNVSIWRPVVVEILQGYCNLSEDDFIKNCPTMYDLVLKILDKQLPQELRSSIQSFLVRVGEVYVRI